MPRLDRLLPREAVNATAATAGRDELQGVTAEQLFSDSLLSQRLLGVRKQAAAICAAKPIRMSALLQGNSHESRVSSQWAIPLHNADMSSLEDCIDLTVSVALDGHRALLLVSNLPLMAKLLAAALQRRLGTHNGSLLSADNPDALYAPLQRISLTQCRDVFHALCKLSEMQQTWKESSDGYRLLVLAPLCELLGPFTTSAGLNVTGEGMRRMLQLALKRTRANAPVQIRVIQPSRSSNERSSERLGLDTFRNDDAQDYEDDGNDSERG